MNTNLQDRRRAAGNEGLVSDASRRRHLARLAGHIALQWVPLPVGEQDVDIRRARLSATLEATMLVRAENRATDPEAGSVFVYTHPAEDGGRLQAPCAVNIAFVLPGSSPAVRARAAAELKERFLAETLKAAGAGGDRSVLCADVPLDDREAFAATLADMLGHRLPFRGDFREAIGLILADG